LGVLCFALPIIWTGAAKSNVGAMAYLFIVWAVLIAGGALLTRRLGPDGEAEPGSDANRALPHAPDGQGDRTP